MKKQEKKSHDQPNLHTEVIPPNMEGIIETPLEQPVAVPTGQKKQSK